MRRIIRPAGPRVVKRRVLLAAFGLCLVLAGHWERAGEAFAPGLGLWWSTPRPGAPQRPRKTWVRQNPAIAHTSQSQAGNLSQPMPSSLGPSSTRVASGPFIPPADIGGAGSSGTLVTGSAMPVGQGTGSSVSTQDLPVLASSNSGNVQMSAQPQLAPVTPAPQPVPVVATASTTPSSPVVVPTDAYVHTIASGESLYTIARLYNVTAQAIVSACDLVIAAGFQQLLDRH